MENEVIDFEGEPVEEIVCPACSVSGCECYLTTDHSESTENENE